MTTTSLKNDCRFYESLYLKIQDLEISELNSISDDLKIGLTPDSALTELRETIKYNLKKKIGIKQNAEATTMAQQAMWFLYKLKPASTAYTLKNVFRVPSQTNPDILKQALEAVILNHEILRTTYSDFDGDTIKTIQIVNEKPLLNFEIITSNEWENILQKRLSNPINIETGPIIKVYYFTHTDGNDVCAIHFHHITGDLITFELIQLELWEHYQEIEKNNPVKLKIEQNALNLTALNEISYLNSSSGNTDKEYWMKRLDGDIQQFNVDGKVKPKSNHFNGKIYPSVIDSFTSSQLIEFSKNSGITPYRFFLSVLYTLLNRYSNQNDLIIGSPVSTRRHQNDPEGMGYFVNMLPFRISINSKDSFQDILTKVNTIVTEGLKHSKYPFSQMVSHCNAERNFDKNPIFNVSLTYESPLSPKSKGFTKLYLGGENESVTFNNIEIKSVPFYAADSQFDLSLYIEQIDESFHVWTMFNSEIFSEHTIQMLAKHFESLTKLVLNNPDLPVSSLNYLSPEELNKLLNIWNKASLPHYPVQTLVQTFEKQVEERPYDIALSFESHKVTYEKLNCYANKLARKLKDSGIINGDLIPLCFDPRPEMIISIMGVLKAGAAYVPLNPAYPKNRVESIVEDVKPKIILTEKKYSSLFQNIEAEILLIDDSGLLESDLANTNLNVNINLENTAYIIYTSGSTGVPKGVMITHQNVSRLFSSTDTWFRFTHNDVWSLFHSFAFDFSVWEIFGAILFGGRLVIIPYLTTRNPEQILNIIEQEKITVLNQTPTAFGQLSQTIMRQPHEKIASLKYIIFGGEALNLNSLNPWFTRFGDQSPRLINMYGITETTVHVTYRPIKTEDCINETGSLIGVPIPDLQLYILDESYNLLPTGWVGEIFVGGAGLAKGYFNRKELTDDRFININLNGIEKQRLYKSGDLGRFLSNGDIEYVGRKDNQVKIRGFRIELGDIEAKLIEHPSVQKAVVTVEKVQKDIKNLKAYVVLKEDCLISATELKLFLKTKIPDYMVPAFFIQIPHVPLTINNKTDIKQMEKIGIKLDFPVLDGEEIHSDIGRNIKTIWQEVLNIDQIGQQSNFFDLGGDSSSIIQVHYKLLTRFSYKLEVVDLFRYPTINALTDYISQSQTPSNSEQNIDLTKQEPSDIELNQRLLSAKTSKIDANNNGIEIAIIGIACKFPEAKNLSEFYNNLITGKECLTTFSNDELYKAGISDDVVNDKNYVKRSGIIENVEQFDNNVFNYTPRETELIDPQHRMFLQTAWESLEDAGYDPEKYTGKIGVFAGCSGSTYLINNICKSSKVDDVSQYPVLLGNEKDFLSTRVSFKLKLTGPSMTVQTGCSTSLVSVHLGCQSILNGESDIVLAGGVTVRFPQISGYKYQEGGIPSPDGYCRPFDSEACGTVVSDGVGVVVLKLLTKAIRDKDHIYSVIKATSINNDGADKVGFTAPSVNGQIQVMQNALNTANVDPSSISYIEAHGTGTVLGDPIEFAALKHVYRGAANNKKIALGSVKANIGHTDVASGIAGLIKTSLMLKNKVIFPQINFKLPNPLLSIENSPMYIQQEPAKWEKSIVPRRAAVSSFGLGGTNVHAILEEPDFWLPSENNLNTTNIEQQLVMISSETSKSLKSYKQNLVNFLDSSCQYNLEDIAYTLAIGRKSMKKRFYCIVKSKEELWNNLTYENFENITNQISIPKIIFLMEVDQKIPIYNLYSTYKDNNIFKSALEECLQVMDNNFADLYVRKLIFENEEYNRCNDEKSKYVVTFIVSYALIRMLESFNVIPFRIVGSSHSELLSRCINHNLSAEQTLIELVNSTIPLNVNNHITDTIKENEDDSIIILTLSSLKDTHVFNAENIRHIQFDTKKSHQCHLEIIGELWSLGALVLMEKFYSQKSVSRVSLPTYSFDTDPYFITPDLTNKKISGVIAKKTETIDQIVYTKNESDLHREKIRETIKRLWKEVLGVTDITHDDDIYELCGDSFAALLMNAEIEKEFKIKLSNKSFIESNTLDKLTQNISNILEHKVSSLSENIVKFKTDGKLPPIFLIHPAGGTVMGYKALVKHIPHGHPIYGIQYPVHEIAGKVMEMKDLAKIYVDSINKIYPGGPVIVGGHSFGGNAAIEMVLQLEAAGRSVEHLIMFDSHPPKAYFSNTVFSESMFLKAFPIICGMFFGNKEVPKDMDTKSLDSVIEYLKIRKWIPWGFDNNEFRMYYDLWRSNHNTLRSHMPGGKVKCNFLFFRAYEFQPQEILDALNIKLYPDMDLEEWSLFSENPIQVINVSGTHYTMLDEPNVNLIGSCLAKVLTSNEQQAL